MRIALGHYEDEIEINVIPLIDVMLTLLMFFVLTTTFVHNAKLKITLPEASATETRPENTEIVVLVDQQGRYYVGNNEVLNPGLETLKAALQKSLTSPKTQRIVLQADGRATHQSVVTALDAFGQLGVSNISIATMQPPRAQ